MIETKTSPTAAANLNGLPAEPIKVALAEARAAVAKAIALAKAAQDAGTHHCDSVLRQLKLAYDCVDSVNRDWDEACSPAVPLDPAAADLVWALDHYNELRQKYLNNHVAVVDRQVLGSGPNATILENEIAHQYGLHPDRIVITFID